MHVIVIGAGVVGASTAYHLVRAGADVTVVDRGDAGQATAAGAGIVGPWLSAEDDPTWQRIAYAAAADYPSLVARLADDGGSDVGYAQVGALLVDTDGTGLDDIESRMRARAREWPQMGAVTRLIRPEPHQRFRVLNSDVDAVWVPGAARVDGRRLREALLGAAVRHGARVREGGARPRVQGGRVTGVLLGNDATALPADAVVAATGAWSRQLAREVGHELAVDPERGQIVHLRLPDRYHDGAADTAHWPIVQPTFGPYLLGFPEGRVVLGATREPDAGFDARVTALGLYKLLGPALIVAPGLADATVLPTRVGLRPQSADGLPVLGPLPGIDGLVLATGLGATGLTIGPLLGRLAAQLTTGAAPDLDLAPYAPRCS